MLSLRALLTVVLLALLSMPEGLLLHQCGCGRIFDCCCRAVARPGASCHAGSSGSHCSTARPAGTPSSLRRAQEPLDRYGTSLSAGFPRPRVLWAGRSSTQPPRAPAGLAFQPPVPPPRSAGCA